MNHTRRARFGRLQEIAFVLLAAVLGLLLLEGVASVAHFVMHGFAAGEILPAEYAHTRFDPELGWVNVPDIEVPNLYSVGVSLRTNSRGFRGSRELSVEVPYARKRIVCSGDSFTMGYGVADDQSWPAVLEGLSPILETVNMGQGGYGLDQAYLWYRRDGSVLEHDALVVAFITDDFTRMERTRSAGASKPKLILWNGQLTPTNVPLSRVSRLETLWTQNGHLLRDLRLVQAMAAALGRAPTQEPVPSPEVLGPVVTRLFEDLVERNAAKGSVLLCVYLPTAWDYGGSQGTERWRTFLRNELARRNIAFLDLVVPFRELSYESAAELFLGSQRTGDLEDRGHYSADGNRFVAAAIYDRLAEVAELGLAR
jgi:hypothetical protein